MERELKRVFSWVEFEIVLEILLLVYDIVQRNIKYPWPHQQNYDHLPSEHMCWIPLVIQYAWGIDLVVCLCEQEIGATMSRISPE